MTDASPCSHLQFFGAREFCPDCGLSRTEALVEACAPFLKDDETPAECIVRNRRDVDGCLTMLIDERRKVESLRSRLAETEQLLSACYSPVRRIAEGGSRTREDLDLAAETFAALKRYLKPVAVPADSAPAVTGNCGLCGQPRADHAEVAPDGKPYCRMKSGRGY